MDLKKRTTSEVEVAAEEAAVRVAEVEAEVQAGKEKFITQNSKELADSTRNQVPKQLMVVSLIEHNLLGREEAISILNLMTQILMGVQNSLDRIEWLMKGNHNSVSLFNQP